MSAKTSTPTPAPAGTTFDDEFNSLSLHETWQPGDKWQLIAPDSPYGRGGPAWNESGTQWWVNPYNPNTPCNGVYSVSNGKLHLGLLPTPPAEQSYIDGQGGTDLSSIGALLNTSQTDYQKYGYYELSAAVDRVPGFDFHADTENVQLTGTWPPEIDLDIYTDASGVQHVAFQVATNSGYRSYNLSSKTGFDPRSYHTYAWNWQSNYITFYIDGAPVWKTANPGGVYQTEKEFLYIGTYANYPEAVAPSPASLPAYASLDYVRVYQNKPPTRAPVPTPAVVLTPASGGSITDASGNIWTLTSAGNVDENGTAVAGGGGTAALTYVASADTIWGEDATSLKWYSWTNGAWVGPAATSPLPTAPGPTPVVVLTPASGGSITDASGNTWTLTSAGDVDENGNAVAGGGGTAALTYVASTKTIWGEDATSLKWYSWSNGAWVGPAATSPLPSITVQMAGQTAVTVNAITVHNQTTDGATISLTTPGVAKIVLGAASDTMTFTNMSGVNLTAGSGSEVVVANAGTNTFTAAKGALDVTGGSGADAYVFHAGDGNLIIKDFLLAKGDTLMVDKSLQSSFAETSDGHRGVIISFGSNAGHIDLTTVASLPTTSIHYV